MLEHSQTPCGRTMAPLDVRSWIALTMALGVYIVFRDERMGQFLVAVAVPFA